MSKTLEKQIEEVSCRALNQQGQGVATLADGLTVFVNGLLPSEVARIRLTEKKKSYAVGKIIKMLESSPERCEPACPVFGRCGGCTLQHIEYPAQLRYKADRVRDALLRIGGFSADSVQALLPAGSTANGTEPPWQYRAKSQMPIKGTELEPLIGFYAAGSHEVVDSEVCPIQDAAADLVRKTLREALHAYPLSIYDEAAGMGLLRHLLVRCGVSSRDVLVVLVVNLSMKRYDSLPDDHPTKLFFKSFGDKCKEVLLSRGYNLSSLSLNHNNVSGNLITTHEYSPIYFSHDLTESILGLTYRISPAAFFQVNPRQTAALYQAALDAAQLGPDELAFDLYCGTGSISLQLARSARRVKACEMVQSAIDDAKLNAADNNVENVEFYTGKAELLVPEWLEAGEQADVIVVDPPRKGLEASLVETLRLAQAKRIVYVSCDPATLARDCKRLCEEGLYELQSIETFDMFPHSMHVETVVLMSRKDK